MNLIYILCIGVITYNIPSNQYIVYSFLSYRFSLDIKYILNRFQLIIMQSGIEIGIIIL